METDLLQSLIYQFELLTPEDSYEEWMNMVIDEINFNEEMIDILYEFSVYLYQKRYLELQINLLTQLYQFHDKEKIAYDIAVAYYELGKFELAEGWLNNIVESKQTYKSIKLKAQLLYETGRFIEAKAVLKELIRQHPTKYFAYLMMAKIYEFEAENNKAIKYYQIIYDYFKHKPIAREVRINLIRLFIASEQINIQAINDLIYDPELLLETSEEFLQAAEISIYLHNYDKSEEFIRNALNIDRESMEAQVLLLELFAKQKNYQAFNQQLSWLLENLPEYHELMTKVILITAYFNQISANLIHLAIEYIPTFEDIDDKILTINQIVQYYLIEKQSHIALNILKSFDDPQLNEINLSHNYARIYENLNDYDQAIYYYELALEHLISDVMIATDFTNLLIKLGENERAKNIINRYYQTFYDTKELQKLRHSLD